MFGSFEIPVWVMVMCSSVMTIGSLVGGYKIIKTVGMKMVKLETYQGVASDLSASICLLGLTLFGIPVSTTQVKTTAIMGVGASKRLSNVNWDIVKNMGIAWLITFPVCGFLGYLVTTIFMSFF